MTTMIRLGEGADAVEVEDGAVVPLVRRTAGALVILASRGLPLLHVGYGRWVELDLRTGKPLQDEWQDGFRVEIDLPALRKERAPKVETVFAFSKAMPPPLNMPQDLPILALYGNGDWPLWVHRAGVTKEQWRAFDAAMGDWIALGDDTNTVALLEAARALGYGAKR